MNIGGAEAMACMRRQKQSARSVLCGPGALCAQFSKKSGRDLFGDVPQPLFLAVADVDEGHLREFVAAQNQVNPERREVPDKRRDKAERRDAGDPAEDEHRVQADVEHERDRVEHRADAHLFHGGDELLDRDRHDDREEGAVELPFLGVLHGKKQPFPKENLS